MIKNIFRGALLLITATLLFSCSAKTSKIVIVSTNDIHAAIDQFPSLATLVNEYRSADSVNFMLIDAGDRWTGNPFVDLATEKCLPMIELCNKLGYDVGVMGNHEFDFGLELLSERMNQASFQKMLANGESNGSALQNFPPYIFMEVGDKKIGLIGLTTVTKTGYPEGDPATFGSFKFTDPFVTAAKLRNLKDSCDMLIGVTHIGFPEDSILAVQFPELDLIIGGHSHTVIPEGRKIGNTIVTQTGRNLTYAGVTTITFKGKKVVDIENRLVKLDTIAPSPEYVAMVDVYNNDPGLIAKVGYAKDSFNRIAMENLASDILRECSKTDISMYHYGGIRTYALPQGSIRIADIYRTEPFSTKPVILKMTEAQLRDMLIRKYNSTGKESHRADLLPSGMKYTIFTNEAGDAEDVVFEFDKPKSVYTVAIPDYVEKTYEFNTSAPKSFSNELVTDMMKTYFATKSPITPNTAPRTVIKPMEKK